MALVNKLLGRSEILEDPLARELVFVLTGPTGRSTAGYPYLGAAAWRRFRDWVPHILGAAPRVLTACEAILNAIQTSGASRREIENSEAARDVVRQVVLTAAITAPPDLFVLRWVVAGLQSAGVARILLEGREIREGCLPGILDTEVAVDLRFLISRGYLVRTRRGFRLSENASAGRILQLDSPDSDPGPGAASMWRDAILGKASSDSLELLSGQRIPEPVEGQTGEWQATTSECTLGSMLVPLVLGLRGAGKIDQILGDGRVNAELFGQAPVTTAIGILCASGLSNEEGELNEVGQRVLSRGIGPFGIIAAYHPYLSQLDRIFREGRGAVHVQRDTNITASQDANARTFLRANRSLDRFCEDTGFRYKVFIEHAMGRGEAIRQRYGQSGTELRYVGADLEDAAIDAAEAERAAGRLPAGLVLVRNADIGKPEILFTALRDKGLSAHGAVMVVGNGFHEVREQTDEFMTAVLKQYCESGLLLLFTEESALSADDLLESAWNTYHAGFKYVHERSGQGLRPAVPGPPQPLEGKPPASWTECALKAGYVSAKAYRTRGRTVYPYTPPSGHNPAISVNHFFVPEQIAVELGLDQ